MCITTVQKPGVRGRRRRRRNQISSAAPLTTRGRHFELQMVHPGSGGQLAGAIRKAAAPPRGQSNPSHSDLKVTHPSQVNEDRRFLQRESKQSTSCAHREHFHDDYHSNGNYSDHCNTAVLTVRPTVEHHSKFQSGYFLKKTTQKRIEQSSWFS